MLIFSDNSIEFTVIKIIFNRKSPNKTRILLFPIIVFTDYQKEVIYILFSLYITNTIIKDDWQVSVKEYI